MSLLHLPNSNNVLTTAIGYSDSLGFTDTTSLLYRKPWYSCEYNELIKKDSLNLYGNIFKDAYYTQDIRGLKQYELTDHLGNVLATVSDKRAAGITTTLLSGADSIVTFRPVLASTYDYYPFGSFMPGRYMEDSNSYCFTTTETKYVVVPFLEIATPSSGPSALINPDAGAPPTVTDVPGGGVDIEFDPADAGTMASVSFASGIDAPANTQVEADLEVSVLDAVFNISIIDDSTGNVLASKQVANLQGNTKLLKIIIPNPASTTSIRVTLDQAGSNTNVIRINYVKTTRYTTVSVNVISTVCNTEKYPFGFNGQMKVDEVAGKGNHNTAQFWEYDTRTGRRMNKDDWNGDPSVSTYSTFSGSPISRNDPLGNVDDWVEKKDGSIAWDKDATSQATTKPGEKYLGKNVLVGTHNRDANLNEPINSAKFDLYLESNKMGPSATIEGNTVPADVESYGTLKEGIYPAKTGHRSKYPNEKALIINKGKDLPTVKGNPHDPKGKPANQQTLTGVFFHKGNTGRASLKTSAGKPISEGCQTGPHGAGSSKRFDKFMGKVPADFNGSYYLRPKK